jgi:hypothetical protein
MADQKDPTGKPTPAPEKRPAPSSDHDENLIRDDSGEEGLLAGQQQTGLKETAPKEEKKKAASKGKDTMGGLPNSGGAKTRYGA